MTQDWRAAFLEVLEIICDYSVPHDDLAKELEQTGSCRLFAGSLDGVGT